MQLQVAAPRTHGGNVHAAVPVLVVVAAAAVVGKFGIDAAAVAAAIVVMTDRTFQAAVVVRLRRVRALATPSGCKRVERWAVSCGWISSTVPSGRPQALVLFGGT